MKAKAITPTLLYWQFGPNWPGKRCLAKTRKGTPCQKPALRGRPRCQLHGAKGGAPEGALNGNYKHGLYTKEMLKRHRESMAEIKYLYAMGKRIKLFN